MPDVAELGRRVKAKYPQYSGIDDAELGRRIKAKYPQYSAFTDIPPPQQPEGAVSSFQTGLAGPLLRNVLNTAADIYNRPGETLERAGRAGLEFLSAFDPAGNAYQPTVASQEPRLQELRARAAAERPETLRLMERGLQEYEARPRTRGGRIAGVTGSILGEVAFPTAPETAVGNIIAAPFAGAAVSTAGKFVAPILRRIRGAKGAAAEVEAAIPETIPAAAAKAPAPVESAAAKATTEGTGPAATQGASTVTQPVDALQSAFVKLGTDDADQIGAMIASANRRYVDKITPEVRQQAIADWNVVKQLTPEEHRALGQVLPARGYHPVTEVGEARAISDFPEGEINAQLEANLRELEAFFTPEGRAPIPTVGRAIAAAQRTPTSPVLLSEVRAQLPNLTKRQFDAEVERLANEGEIFVHRHDAPGQLTAAERRDMVRIGKDYYGAATVNGPRLGTAAMEVAPAAPPRPPGNPPPELTGKLFKRQPAQKQLFSGRTVAPAERTPVIQTISSLVKAGMLTKPTTHLRNLGGNLGFQISEELARVPGAIADIAASVFTKRRQFGGPSLRQTARSAYEAATKGRQEAFDILRTGKSIRDVEGLREINSGSKIADAYANGVFRVLRAEDQLFHSYAYRRALESRARSAVLTEIRQGKATRGQLGERVRQLIKNPSADLEATARFDAEVATFNNPNITGDIRTGISSALERFGKKYPAAKAGTEAIDFAIDRIMPFTRTPANIIGRLLEYSGVTGGPKTIYRLGKAIITRSMSPAEQHAFSQTFGRASIGSGLLALGYIGYRDGWLTGLQEDETTKRARDTAAGRIPGAVLVNGEWHQIVGFSPIGNLMAVGATLARETEQEEQQGYLEQAGTIGKVFGQAALEQPLLGGLQQLTEGIKRPGTAGARYAGGIAGQAVPGVVSDVGQLLDPSQREATTFGARVMERIPGVRQYLPRRTDVLGQPTEDRMTQPLDPTRTTTANRHPLFAELVRLDTGVSKLEQKKGEDDGVYRTRLRQFGALYLQYGQALVVSPEYQQADDDIKLRAIKTLNERAKTLVNENRQEFAEAPLSPQALIRAAEHSKAEQSKKNPANK